MLFKDGHRGWHSTLLGALTVLAATISVVQGQLPRPPPPVSWPNFQIDELETILIEGGIERGHPQADQALVRNSLVKPFVENCELAGDQSVNAQWLRLAYHDMATHNVNGDGLGGLDGSIRFELDRPENVGGGMFTTAFDLSGFASPHVSSADLIALGTVHAVVGCGGPIIPFRGGRVDKYEAGPAGVPQPHETLDEHVESFRKQGFTKTEMIELVACGHTMGGVTNLDFPDIVDPSPPVPPDVPIIPIIDHFDSTLAFDNTVAQEYLSGTTKNPLVVNRNQTVVSDLRIFASDGNQTMRALANPKIFQDRCSVLLERMINTVPKGTILTDIIKPIPVKIGRSFLTLNSSALALQTSIRFLSDNPARRVTVKWNDRVVGSNKIYSAAPFNKTAVTTTLATRLGLNPTFYWFTPPVNATTSISKFWFEVDEGRGNTTVYDNGGLGYSIEQDQVVYANHLSSRAASFRSWTVVIGIRNGATISNATATVTTYSDMDVPTRITTPLNPSAGSTTTSVSGFDLYEFTLTADPDRFSVTAHFDFDVSVILGGQAVKEEYLPSTYIFGPK